MGSHPAPLISADDEWSPLKAIIVGRAEHSCFPADAQSFLRKYGTPAYADMCIPNNPFPDWLVKKAQEELDNFAKVLEEHGVKVYRPEEVDWVKEGGYTSAMPRDTLMAVGNTLIESLPAWSCRKNEISLGFTKIIDQLHGDSSRVVRSPALLGKDTIFDGRPSSDPDDYWVINNSRPAFDVADFMRFGKTIVGQTSHVTNQRGIDYVRSVLPDGYNLEILESNDESRLHMDTTLLPLRKGTLVYNPHYVDEKILRKLRVFDDWELHPYPLWPKDPKDSDAPSYLCSRWLILNGLSLDENRFFAEASAPEFADWVKEKFGIECILLPFKHVNSIGGSFHCATTDLVREPRDSD